MSIALILAGHGSHISANTAGVVWDSVAELRQRSVADEVTACFWKEQPHFNQVLRTVVSATVVIVPIFTAKGYFSQQVIPSEMGLPLTSKSPLPQGARGLERVDLLETDMINRVSKDDGNFVGTASMLSENTKTSRKIYYTRTLGEHPYLETIVQKRVTDAIEQANLPHKDTAVAIIGHGTKRSKTTRETTIKQVQAIQRLGLVAQSIDAYLDDDPDISSIYDRTTAKNLIVVPFFLASGSHTTQDVPNALGIEYGDYPANVNGREVYYTPPIGTDAVICDLIIQLARDTGLPFVENPTDDVWSGFPQAGCNELLSVAARWIAPECKIIFGQLQITPHAVQPINSTQEFSLDNPSDLRKHVRENPFRSLTTSDDLPRDWIVPINDAQQIAGVVETVYPSVIAEWAAHQRGEFDTESLSEVIERHKSMFTSFSSADTATIAHCTSKVCGRCLRHPTWHEGQTSSGKIPCSSPCNHWLSTIKETINDR